MPWKRYTSAHVRTCAGNRYIRLDGYSDEHADLPIGCSIEVHLGIRKMYTKTLTLKALDKFHNVIGYKACEIIRL